MTKPFMSGKTALAGVAIAAIVAVTVTWKAGLGSTPVAAQPALPDTAPGTTAASNAPASGSVVELTSSQLNAVKIETVGTDLFPVEKEAVGNIDYVDDLSVQVFPPYQGKLLKTFAELGDVVKKGQKLYTIDSPDLVQAESTLIGAAATLDLTTKELQRARDLYSTNYGVSERELEQAVNDQQTAEGALRAARGAVRIFGKNDAEIDQIIATRRIDPVLIVPSPIAGQVTYFDAPPGLLVQPGTAPAPFTVSDMSVKWMLANVIESDAPLCHVGQSVKVSVMAYPGRIFGGKIAKVYPNVDPTTHRMTIRCEIADPQDQLRPGMLANFEIIVHDPAQATALAANGVVRNGDGTYAAWVTTDRHHFVQKIIRIGLQNDGRYQVLDGLQQGELAVTDGAIFLNNILEAPPSD
jgi:membrane fusion protein, heavy metal efflux system